MPTPIMWQPSPTLASSAHVTHFMRDLNRSVGTRIESFHGLYEWTIAHPDLFWMHFWRWSKIKCSTPPRSAHEPSGAIRPAWFPGAQLNYTENLLRTTGSRPAIIFRHENGTRRSLSWDELTRSVHALGEYLRTHGVRAGDTVGAVLPTTPEAVVAMLATFSIGAVWSSCSPDFGTPALHDRLSQISPRVLFLTHAYTYKGTVYSLKEKNDALRKVLPPEGFVIEIPAPHDESSGVHDSVPWEKAVAPSPSQFSYFQGPSDHPLAILFSSGTTGRPKCIVHSAGGTLVEHLKEHLLHCNFTESDRVIYQTTCGWMMWNWLISALATGATIVLYDGHPFERDGRILFNVIDEEEVTVFGTSAKFLSIVEQKKIRPRLSHSLQSLRTILSTGSILPPTAYDFVARDITPSVQLSSISGGTDIIGCFALGAPTLPVYRGEVQTRSLGLNVEALNSAGMSVVGEKGELVCSAPFPSMPLGFLNDPNQERFRKSYFRDNSPRWCHGDIIEITPRNTVLFYGRSDAVLNPGGIRIGTGEIYAALSCVDEIEEACAVAAPHGSDEKIVLFITLKEHGEFSEPLRHKINSTLRSRASPHHVPSLIIAVTQLPHTQNGKLAELAVRSILRSEAISNREALANPESLEEIKHQWEKSLASERSVTLPKDALNRP